MKTLRTILFMFAALVTARAADVSFDFKDIAGGADYFRLATSTNKLRITPTPSPLISPSSILGADWIERLPDTNGAVTVTNLQAGIFYCAIKIRNIETHFTITVTNCSCTIDARTIVTTPTNGLSLLQMAYTMASADARFIVAHGTPTNSQVLTWNAALFGWWPSNSVGGSGGSGDVTTAQLNSASNVLRNFTLTQGGYLTNLTATASNYLFGLIVSNGTNSTNYTDSKVATAGTQWTNYTDAKFNALGTQVTNHVAFQLAVQGTNWTNNALALALANTNYTAAASNSLYSYITNAVTVSSNGLFLEITNRITITSNGIIAYVVGQSNALNTRLMAIGLANTNLSYALAANLTNKVNSLGNSPQFTNQVDIIAPDLVNGMRLSAGASTFKFQDYRLATDVLFWDTTNLFWTFNYGITNLGNYVSPGSVTASNFVGTGSGSAGTAMTFKDTNSPQRVYELRTPPSIMANSTNTVGPFLFASATNAMLDLNLGNQFIQTNHSITNIILLLTNPAPYRMYSVRVPGSTNGGSAYTVTFDVPTGYTLSWNTNNTATLASSKTLTNSAGGAIEAHFWTAPQGTSNVVQSVYGRNTF